MQKAIYPLLVSLLFLSACLDPKDIPFPLKKDYFRAYCITNITLAQTNTHALTLLVEVDDDFQDTVRLTVEGVPQKVACTISQVSGTTSFTPTLTFKANLPAVGEYPAKVILTGSSGQTKTYDFKIIVTKPANVMHRLIGNYRIRANNCDTVTRVSVMQPFEGTGLRFYALTQGANLDAEVDTVAQTITIARQPFVVGQGTYEATGTYTDHTIFLNGQIRLPGSSNATPCSFVLSKY